MAQPVLVIQSYFFDPKISGLDTTLLKEVVATVSAITAGISVKNAAAADAILSTKKAFLGGDLRILATVPVKPTAGDARVIGFMSPTQGRKNALMFETVGTSFFARSYDKNGNKEETEITWLDTTWTAAVTEFSFRVHSPNRVEFLVNGNVLASHQQYVPEMAPRPLYVQNHLNDDLVVNLLDFRGLRAIASV